MMNMVKKFGWLYGLRVAIGGVLMTAMGFLGICTLLFGIVLALALRSWGKKGKILAALRFLQSGQRFYCSASSASAFWVLYRPAYTPSF